MRLYLISFEILWEVGAFQSKKCSPGSNFSVDSFTRKHRLFFDETFWYINDKPCISKQRLSNLRKIYFLWFFLNTSDTQNSGYAQTLLIVICSLWKNGYWNTWPRMSKVIMFFIICVSWGMNYVIFFTIWMPVLIQF